MKGWKSQKKTLFEYMELKTTQCAQYFKRVKEVNEANARLVAGYYIYKYIKSRRIKKAAEAEKKRKEAEKKMNDAKNKKGNRGYNSTQKPVAKPISPSQPLVK